MLKNKRLKSLILGLAFILTTSSIGLVAYAAAGWVEAYASFSYTGNPLEGYTFYGSGRAEEQVEAPSNVKNIYAKCVVGNSAGTVLASDETTEHYTNNAYASCSYDIARPNTKYRASTLPRARYESDDSVSQSIAYTNYEDFTPIIVSDPLTEEFKFDTTDLKFIPAEAFAEEEQKTIQVTEKISNIETFAFIFGDHFIAAKIGDTLPSGVYLNKDGSEAYIFEKKVDGSIIKTTYEVKGSQYKVIDTQKTIASE